MPSSPLPAAAHTEVRELLLGPERPATPVAATRAAVVLAVPGQRPVCVASADAVRLPGSLVLGAPAARLDLAAFRPGTPARVGEGMVRVGELAVRPARWWSTRAVRAARRPGPLGTGLGRLGELLDAAPAPAGGILGRTLETAAAGFARALTEAVGPAHRDAARVAPGACDRCLQAAAALLGLGPGLTPSGDDVLAAMLVTVHRLRPESAPAVQKIGDAVGALASTRTTPTSAALLAWAARGEGAPELLALVDAVGQGGDVAGATARLLRVGHSSGRDLAEGLRTGAGVVLELLHAPPRPDLARTDPSHVHPGRTLCRASSSSAAAPITTP